MPTASITVTVQNQYVEGNLYKIMGTLAVDASPDDYATGGLTLNLTGAGIKASRTPLFVQIYGVGGYIYSYTAGSDASNGKMEIFEQDGSGPLVEIAASAIPAGVSGDTIKFEAAFKGMF